MQNHQACKMKFRNQLAVNLVKLLAPVHSYRHSDASINVTNIVDTAFDLANSVCTRIEADIVKCDEPKFTPPKESPVDYAAEAAARDNKTAEPEEHRFFLLTDEGQLFPNRDESFEDFLARALPDLEGK